ncbi:MAG: anti-sigma F factor [Acutalibacteraceae bacterium]|nr:anti-sigma F factor [Acutalibacteraceae bacterium]
MKVINEMKLTFDSKSSNEAFARGAVSSFVVQLDPTIAELSDIKTAVSEAVTNAIVHGYSNTIGTVTIKVQITENNTVIIQVKDKGVGIENIPQAMEPMFTTGGSERAGLGFAVMQSFMDKVKVISKPNKGTTVTMEKYIMPRVSART